MEGNDIDNCYRILLSMSANCLPNYKTATFRYKMTASYDFSTLLPADFEDFARELVGAELKIRFEAFAAGPDGGVDGRHSKSGISIILQAKHYQKSTFSQLTSSLNKEIRSICNLRPNRYILVTSQQLTPSRKSKIDLILSPWIQNPSDVIGQEDLNTLLRSHPNIEKSHIKLWLSSTAVLERLLNSAMYNMTLENIEEIATKIRVYATNPSFDDARIRLEKYNILIISGPPGVGKTTLAEMLANAYIREKWDLLSIRSLDDGFAAINDKQKQIFFFDDFLGRIALDERALAASESDLARFLQRIRRSKNARFILTTRAYLLEDAKRASEHLADPRIKISTYILDVGAYSRNIRARILYNHLAVSSTPKKYKIALVNSGEISKIVDHPNYKPRVIEWMTDHLNISDVTPSNYVNEFLETLKNPRRLWDTAFRNHIVPRCRHLLISLYFESQYGVEIATLKSSFLPLHQRLCLEHHLTSDPKDFEEALRVLEGGFVTISGTTVNFINPSLKDYMRGYLQDDIILSICAEVSISAHWAASVWMEVSKKDCNSSYLQIIPKFLAIAQKFLKIRKHFNSGSQSDLTISRRLELLLEWYQHSKNDQFKSIARTLLIDPPEKFRSFYDLSNVIRTNNDAMNGLLLLPINDASWLIQELNRVIIEMLTEGASSDDLVDAANQIHESGNEWNVEVNNELDVAIHYEIACSNQKADDIDSESTLEEYAETIRKLGSVAHVPSNIVELAVEHIDNRIADVSNESQAADSPSLAQLKKPYGNEFTDSDLNNLFGSLII